MCRRRKRKRKLTTTNTYKMSSYNIQTKPNPLAPTMPEDMLKEAATLLSIPSTTHNEVSMVMYLNKRLHEMYLNKRLHEMHLDYDLDSWGNMIITKGKAAYYPCFCAHLDTVHTYRQGFNVKFHLDDDDKVNPRMYAHAYDDNHKPVGIGGDDKCGIFVCLYLLKHIDNIKVIFFSTEESGGVGSNNIRLSFFDNCKFLAGIDRWNGEDFVNEYSGKPTMSKSMRKVMAPLLQKYGYKHATGFFTDSFNVMEREIKLSCCNISCGYYSHHTESEYIDLNELYNSCLFCEEMAKTVRYRYEYIYEVVKYKYKGYDFDNSYSSYYKYNPDTKKYDIPSNSAGSAFKYGNDAVRYCEICNLELLPKEFKYCTFCDKRMGWNTGAAKKQLPLSLESNLDFTPEDILD
jgi:tripeptide aminopeptidase